MVDMIVIETQDDTSLEKMQEYLRPNGIEVEQTGECEFLATVPESADALGEVTDAMDDNGVDCYVSYHENN